MSDGRWKLQDLPTKDVLRMIAEHGTGGESMLDWLIASYPGVPYKVALAKLESLAARGFVEYGVVVGRCWITQEGLRYIGEG